MKNGKTNKINCTHLYELVVYLAMIRMMKVKGRGTQKLKGSNNKCYFSFKDEGAVLRAEAYRQNLK